MSDQSRAAGGVGVGVGGGEEMLMTEQTGVEGEAAVLISRESPSSLAAGIKSTEIWTPKVSKVSQEAGKMPQEAAQMTEHLGAHANEQESVVGEQMPMEAAQPVGEVRPVTGEEAQEVWDADIYAYMHTLYQTRARAHTHTHTHTKKYAQELQPLTEEEVEGILLHTHACFTGLDEPEADTASECSQVAEDEQEGPPGSVDRAGARRTGESLSRWSSPMPSESSVELSERGAGERVVAAAGGGRETDSESERRELMLQRRALSSADREASLFMRHGLRPKTPLLPAALNPSFLLKISPASPGAAVTVAHSRAAAGGGELAQTWGTPDGWFACASGEDGADGTGRGSQVNARERWQGATIKLGSVAGLLRRLRNRYAGVAHHTQEDGVSAAGSAALDRTSHVRDGVGVPGGALLQSVHLHGPAAAGTNSTRLRTTDGGAANEPETAGGVGLGRLAMPHATYKGAVAKARVDRALTGLQAARSAWRTTTLSRAEKIGRDKMAERTQAAQMLLASARRCFVQRAYQVQSCVSRLTLCRVCAGDLERTSIHLCMSVYM